MKLIEKEFIGKGEVSGFKFTRVAETERAYVYKVDDGSGSERYEVFERITSPEQTLVIGGAEIHYEAKELYPKSTKFGITAFSIPSLDAAMEKLNFITNKCNTRDLSKVASN